MSKHVKTIRGTVLISVLITCFIAWPIVAFGEEPETLDELPQSVDVAPLEIEVVQVAESVDPVVSKTEITEEPVRIVTFDMESVDSTESPESVSVALSSAGTEEFIDVFTSYEVYLIAIACVAGMTFTKKAVKIFGKETGSKLLKSPWVGLLLSVGNIPMGAMFGFVPGFLHGSSVVENVTIGAVAGFMSNTIYSFLKRFLPDTMESHAAKGIIQRKGN
jgi:hypothetical protein